MAIPGSSFFTAFYNYHANNPNCKIFLLGAAEGVAKKAMENINRRVGRQIVVGAHSPSYGFERNEQECEELIHIVNESGATVLLVGAGAPKQEKWIAKYRSRMSGVKIIYGSWRYHRLRSRQHKTCSQNIPNLGDGMVLSLPERTQATVQTLFYR